jgi:hypothetical protein
MYEDIVKRLASLGYVVAPEDEWTLNFLIDKVTERILADINCAELPEGLYYVAVDMVCGEFLRAKRSNGTLSGFDAEAAIKVIKEGDTSITYATGDASASTFDGLTDWLINGGREMFPRFRRFVW